MASSYTLTHVSRRTPAGGVIADAGFLEAQQLLLEAFPERTRALFAAFNSRNAQLWDYRNGQVVGAAITSHPTSTEGELHFFAVAPDVRRTGIGRAFYEALEARAFQGQEKVIATSVVPGFFERIGFFNRGVTHTYRGQSEYYMVRVK